MVGFSSFSVAATALVAATLVVAQDPNYKVPLGEGSGDWAAAYKKARAVVAKLTLEEKLNITLTDGGIASIGFPGTVYADGPNGNARGTGHSAVPAAIHAAATFDRDLVLARALIMGAEAYDLGRHTLTAPMINIARSPEAGRNFEGFGADPYLTTEFAVQTVRGIQTNNVTSNAKHYILNEQEHGRSFESSDVDDRAFREIYLPPFEESVRAGLGSIMCSYNAINGTYGCENQHTLGEVLKGQIGFQGYVLTDMNAVHTGVNAFNAGSDLILGNVTYRVAGLYNSGNSNDTGFGAALEPFINNGSVSLARVNDAATRILATQYRIHWDDKKRPTLTEDRRNVQRDHKIKIREIAAAGHVLLKNEKQALPLKKPFSIAVFGLDAGADPNGVNTAPAHFVNTYPGNATYPFGGGSASGTVAMGWGSGWVSFPYLITPIEALQARARQDGTWIQAVTDNYNLFSIGYLASQQNDACIVFVSANSGEESIEVEGNYGDRNNLTAWHRGDELVASVAATCTNTIVVAHAPSALLMPWADNENVTAIVWAGMPGQESGNALVDVLYGDVNPSGRLPYTIAKEQKDYSASVDFTPLIYQGSQYPIKYNESYYVDYRHFQAKNIDPLYPFGFGLSYTSFSYSGLKVATASKRFRRKSGSTSTKSTPYPDSLYDTLYTVTATVKNTGKLDGHEVAQLYVKLSSEAEAEFKQLKGFERPLVKAGKSATVTFELRKRDIVYWSVEKQQWVLPKSFEVYVGSSSADLKLSKKVAL